jgi:hypothetical protein
LVVGGEEVGRETEIFEIVFVGEGRALLEVLEDGGVFYVVLFLLDVFDVLEELVLLFRGVAYIEEDVVDVFLVPGLILFEVLNVTRINEGELILVYIGGEDTINTTTITPTTATPTTTTISIYRCI